MGGGWIQATTKQLGYAPGSQLTSVHVPVTIDLVVKDVCLDGYGKKVCAYQTRAQYNGRPSAKNRAFVVDGRPVVLPACQNVRTETYSKRRHYATTSL